MANIRDIAKKAGVSVATVSRLINQETSHLVHPETRERLEKIIQKLHYVPNRFARSLSTQKSNTIGMVTAFSTDVVKSPYYEGLIAGIIEGIRPIAYDLKWILIRNEDATKYTLQDLMSKHSVDGLIFLTWQLFPKLVHEIETHKKLPVVLINDYNPHIRSSIMYSDSKKGVEKVCAYLKSKNIKKVGMMRGPEYVSFDSLERYQAFKTYTKKVGILFDPKFSLKCERFEEKAGYDAIKMNAKLFLNPPQLLFCGNDDLAHGALKAFKELKIKVPQDIKLIGYDDAPRNEYSVPRLSSVKQPLETMGRTAVETLIKLITTKHKQAIQSKFEPELVIRDSS